MFQKEESMLVCRRFQKAAVQVKLASARKDAKQYRFQKLPRGLK
jgi:hypothetical protein